MQIKQPKTQVLLTNVAFVRYKKKNKKFEIACYKNKVLDWRRGIEKDIDNVLQIQEVFSNVSRGLKASSADMIKVFKTDDRNKILEKGNLQVSGKERSKLLESKRKEIISIVTSKCVNIETKKPFPINTIENAMKEIHFNISNNESSKKQALLLISQLQKNKILPIQKAQMKIKIIIPSFIGKKIKTDIIKFIDKLEKEIYGNTYTILALIDPGQYRNISDIVGKVTKGKGNVQVSDMAILKLGDEEL